MFDSINLTVKKGFPTEKVLKSMRFGVANALTQTAKQAQAGVQGQLRGTFTLRGKWFEQGNRFGIKVKPATPANLTAKVSTLADWLTKQEEGGTQTPFRNFFAIPTENVRPKGSTKIIRGALKPARLKNSFVVKSKKAGVSLLVQRFGRGRKKQTRIMYILVPRIHVKAVQVFYDPIEKVVRRRLNSNLQKYVQEALNTIRH
jgi:hypothetical protein